MVADKQTVLLTLSIIIVFVETTSITQSKYESVVIGGMCHSHCLSLYGSHIVVSRESINSNFYRPWKCHSTQCRNCSKPCASVPHNKTTCDKTCMDPICLASCDKILKQSQSFAKTGQLPMSPVKLTISRPTLFCTNSAAGKATAFIQWQVSGLHGKEANSTLVFVVSIRRVDAENWNVLGHTSSAALPIERLDSGQSYHVRVTSVLTSGIVGRQQESEQISLLQDGEIGDRPLSIYIKNISPSNGGANVVVGWISGQRPACRLRFYCLPTNCQGDGVQQVLERVLNNQWTVQNLQYGCNYKVLMHAYGSSDRNAEYTSLNFTVPTCLSFMQFNYTLCAPTEPQNVSYTVTNRTEDNADLIITWFPPMHTSVANKISFYKILWWKIPDFTADKFDEPHQGALQLDGTSNNVSLPGFKPSHRYSVSLFAVTPGGQGQAVTLVIRFPELEKDAPAKNNIPLLAIPLSLVTIIGAITIYVCRRKSLLSKHQTAIKSVKCGAAFTTINPFYKTDTYKDQTDASHPLVDDYEVNWAWFNEGECLGEGAFGKVVKVELRKGYTLNKANSQTKTFAVKVLRAFPTDEERRNLMLEIEFMKEVGQHRHIVSLIGCCTIEPDIRLVMDYCPYGDLRNYLRNCREEAQSFRSGKSQGNTSTGSSRSADSGISRNYTRSNTSSTSSSASQPTDADLSGIIPCDHLLSFARQIVVGMEYLSGQRFVHRDLAARNILVCEDKTLKISDFGLTRDVYQNNVYEFSPAKKIPYKWMPIETLFDHVFTTKSDVWSFAVVMWEIVTLGGFPYPGIPDKDLFRMLKDGYRMEKPVNCSQELYELMLECWRPSPAERPSFSELRVRLDTLLQASTSYIDLQIHSYSNEDRPFISKVSIDGNRDSLASDQGVELSPRTSLVSHQFS